MASKSDEKTKALIDNMIAHELHLCSFVEHDYDQSLVDDIYKAANRGYRTSLDTHFIMKDDKIVFIGSMPGANRFIMNYERG